MKKIIIAAAVSALMATSAHADNIMQGAGAMTCTQSITYQRKHPGDISFFMWSQGFMSSMNLTASLLKQPAHRLDDVDAQQASLTDYCQKHPLVGYADATLELYKVLPVIKPVSEVRSIAE